MLPLDTDRLAIRLLTLDDAPFTLRLLLDPDYIAFIADRGARTVEQAGQYLLSGPIESYRVNGHGLFGVESKETGDLIGMCGLLKRDFLDAPDLGYAFLPDYRGQGYAMEAARAVMTYGREKLSLSVVTAFTTPGNRASIRLLEKLGFTYSRVIQMPSDPADLHLFQWIRPA
jgi:RimJ/RimL family protein N-acetyltransferase